MTEVSTRPRNGATTVAKTATPVTFSATPVAAHAPVEDASNPGDYVRWLERLKDAEHVLRAVSSGALGGHDIRVLDGCMNFVMCVACDVCGAYKFYHQDSECGYGECEFDLQHAESLSVLALRTIAENSESKDDEDRLQRTADLVVGLARAALHAVTQASEYLALEAQREGGAA